MSTRNERHNACLMHSYTLLQRKSGRENIVLATASDGSARRAATPAGTTRSNGTCNFEIELPGAGAGCVTRVVKDHGLDTEDCAGEMTKSISLPPGVCNCGAELMGMLMALKAHDDTFREVVKQHPDDHDDMIRGSRTLVLLWVDNQEAIVAANASELEDKPYWPVV